MNRFLKIASLLMLLLVTACANPYVQQARQAIREFYYGPPKNVIMRTIPYEEERWCYGTLGAVECYQEPQQLPVESLVAVYPAERFPTTREAYTKAITQREAAKAKTLPSVKLEENEKKAPQKPVVEVKKPKNIKNLISKSKSN